MLSDSLREAISGLVSEGVRLWLVLEMEPRGLGLREIDVRYGESLPSVGTGEIPPGDKRPNEFMLVKLLEPIERVVEAKELDLGPDAVDDIDPEVEWNRGPGEVRDPDSRRRNRSLALPTVCKDGLSSTGGDDARLFCPAATPGK